MYTRIKTTNISIIEVVLAVYYLFITIKMKASVFYCDEVTTRFSGKI